VFYLLIFRLEQIKKFTAEAPINSASLHQSGKFFVAGGEDFKMYKFDYDTGKEIGGCTLFFFALANRDIFVI
jgi:hypothetical protein